MRQRKKHYFEADWVWEETRRSSLFWSPGTSVKYLSIPWFPNKVVRSRKKLASFLRVHFTVQSGTGSFRCKKNKNKDRKEAWWFVFIWNIWSVRYSGGDKLHRLEPRPVYSKSYQEFRKKKTKNKNRATGPHFLRWLPHSMYHHVGKLPSENRRQLA